jgi:ribosomal protein S7
MSSVWDEDAGEGGLDLEEVTPIPGGSSSSESPLKISPEKLESLAAQVLEKVAREIIPEMAERIIREKIDALLKENE